MFFFCACVAGTARVYLEYLTKSVYGMNHGLFRVFSVSYTV